MSKHRKKCFPKLSRLRKNLWSWHSDIESLMQGLDAPKKNSLVKEESTEEKLDAKCFEMIHNLCKMSNLTKDELVELLKDVDTPRPISRFASSGQLSTGRLSPEKSAFTTVNKRSRSVSTDRRKQTQEKGTHRYRSPTRRKPDNKCLNATWSRSESPSPEEPCRKQLTFDEDDEYFQKSSKKGKKKASPVSEKNSKKIIRDLEEQIAELEKENEQLINDVERLEQEVKWYKENRDYWLQYCKENTDRNGKQVVMSSHGKSRSDYDQLRKQYDHLKSVYENIYHVLKKENPTSYQQFEQLQTEAARYRAERNNARYRVQEMSDKMKWYKDELKNLRSESGYIEKKPKRRYGTRYF